MKTNRKSLLAALDIVGLAVNKSKRGSTLPILDHFAVKALGRTVTLITTNLDTTATSDVAPMTETIALSSCP